MTKLICVTTIIFLLSGPVAKAETTHGFCTLKKSSAFAEDIFTTKVGKRMKGTCKFYIDEFFGRKIINANITVENSADVPLFCQYYVAFFDAEGNLVGCAEQGIFGDEGLEPGESENFGSCLIPLPAGEHEKISSYQITFYESESPIGK